MNEKKKIVNLQNVFDELALYHSESEDLDMLLEKADIDSNALVENGLKRIRDLQQSSRVSVDKMVHDIEDDLKRLGASISDQLNDSIIELLPNLSRSQLVAVYRQVSNTSSLPDEKKLLKLKEELTNNNIQKYIDDSMNDLDE